MLGLGRRRRRRRRRRLGRRRGRSRGCGSSGRGRRGDRWRGLGRHGANGLGWTLDGPRRRCFGGGGLGSASGRRGGRGSGGSIGGGRRCCSRRGRLFHGCLRRCLLGRLHRRLLRLGGDGTVAHRLGGLLGCGLLRRRLLGRLHFFGLMLARESVTLGSTPQAVGLLLDDGGGMALRPDAHCVGQRHDFCVGHPELFSELVHPHVLRQDRYSPFLVFALNRRTGQRFLVFHVLRHRLIGDCQ